MCYDLRHYQLVTETETITNASQSSMLEYENIQLVMFSYMKLFLNHKLKDDLQALEKNVLLSKFTLV
jgi:hypothetical protein